jgi:hypothetical protein
MLRDVAPRPENNRSSALKAKRGGAKVGAQAAQRAAETIRALSSAKNEGRATLTIQLMVLAGLLIYAWAGAVRLTRPITDFYAAGAKVPAVYNGMSIAAGLVAALAYPALAGALEPGWRGALHILGGGAGGLVLSGLLLAPYLRKFGGYTVPISSARGSVRRPEAAAVLAVFLCSFPACRGAGHLAVILARIFAIDLATGIGAPPPRFYSAHSWAACAQARSHRTPYCLCRLRRSASWFGSTAPPRRLEATALFDAVARLKLDTLAAPDRINGVALVFLSWPGRRRCRIS